MKRPVVDASVALAWIITDEKSEAALAWMDLVVEHGAVAPSHWRLEVANGLWRAERTARINSDARLEALSDLSELPIEEDHQTWDRAWTLTQRLAALHGLTVYDAAYLELALREGGALATLDAALRRGAEKCGVISH